MQFYDFCYPGREGRACDSVPIRRAPTDISSPGGIYVQVSGEFPHTDRNSRKPKEQHSAKRLADFESNFRFVVKTGEGKGMGTTARVSVDVIGQDGRLAGTKFPKHVIPNH